MSFGMYLLAFFCSPLYFALRGRWIAALANAVIYFIALVGLVLGVGVFFWAIGMAHAMWDLRSQLVEKAIQRQATLIAREMRETGA